MGDTMAIKELASCTEEQARKLAFLAALISCETPEQMSEHGTCYVPRYLVWRIRNELARAGYDWKEANRTTKRLQGEQWRKRAAASAALYHQGKDDEKHLPTDR